MKKKNLKFESINDSKFSKLSKEESAEVYGGLQVTYAVIRCWDPYDGMMYTDYAPCDDSPASPVYC